MQPSEGPLRLGLAVGERAPGESAPELATDAEGPLAVARRLARPTELAVLAAVPVLLVVVFELPLRLREALALSYLEPTPLTAVTSHFVHLEAAHLGTNIAMYLLVATVAYLLCALSGRRHEFFVAFAVFVLAFPAVLSALNVALTRPALGYGFSGVNTAFFGFLPIALTWYLSSGLGAPVRARDAPILFFASTTLVALLAVPLSFASAAIAVVGLLAAAVYLLESLPRASAVRRRLERVWRFRPGYVEFAVVGAGTLVVFPLAAFPPDPASGGTVLNLYGHLLGYALGFIASYVTFGLVGLDPRRSFE